MPRKKKRENYKDVEVRTIFNDEFKLSEHFEDSDWVENKSSGEICIKNQALVRVANKLYDILHRNTKICQTPDKSNNHSSVVIVEYLLEKTYEVGNSQKRTWSAVGQCDPKNAGRYFQYSTSIAETRACSRALRNILGIPFMSDEEVQEVTLDQKQEFDDNGQIEEVQVNLLKEKFIGQAGKTLKDIKKIIGREIEELEQLTKGEALDVIKAMNSGR